MSISVSGSQITFNDASVQTTAATGFGFKNRLINGSMVIDQRNAGASVTPANGGASYIYTLDRWGVFSTQNSKISVQQNAGSVTPPAGFTNYIGVTSLAATTVASGDIMLLKQAIEANNTSDFGIGAAGASSFTVSFWVRSSLTGAFGGTINNSAISYSCPFTFTISAANTWEQKTVTFSGPTAGTWLTGTSASLMLYFNLGTGSTYVGGTAGTWAAQTVFAPSGTVNMAATNGATFYITGVQLEKGSTATSFDYRPYGTELALCQRYYQKVSGSASYTFPYVCNVSNMSSTITVGTIVFPTSMRAAPTISFSTLKTRAAGGSISAIVVDQISVSNGNVPLIGLAFTTTSLTTYYSDVVLGNNSSSAYIDYSAEL